MVQVTGHRPTLGQTYSLSCLVTGADSILLQPTITYQWLRDGVILNENTSTLSFPSLSASDVGEYSCQVTLTSALLESSISKNSHTHVITLANGK